MCHTVENAAATNISLACVLRLAALSVHHLKLDVVALFQQIGSANFGCVACGANFKSKLY